MCDAETVLSRIPIDQFEQILVLARSDPLLVHQSNAKCIDIQEGCCPLLLS